MSVFVHTMAGLAIIGGLLAANAIALYLMWWLAMLIVSHVPLVGRKYRHRHWDRLNRLEEQPRRCTARIR